MTNSLPELQARLDRLERDNRRMRRTGVGLLVGASSLALMSFTVPVLCKTVTAERLVIHDERGKQRVVVNAYSTDKPSLTLKDAQGKNAARLTVSDGGDINLEVFKEGRPTEASFQLQKKEQGVD